MTLGANQIGAYAADLLDLEDQIEALQEGKRDLYATIRDEHGKAEANALKQAVKLSRMDSEKRTERDEIDTEAQRMLAIIEKGHARRAPRAREIIEEFPPAKPISSGSITVSSDAVPYNSNPAPHAAGQGEGTDAPGSLANQSTAPRIDVGDNSTEVSGAPRGLDPVAATTPPAEEAPPVDTKPTAADQVRKVRPFCQHADDLTKCAGQGRKHCFACQKAHADDVGEAA